MPSPKVRSRWRYRGRPRRTFVPLPMKLPVSITRRQFVRTSALASAAVAGAQLSAAADKAEPWKIIAFSKPFAALSPDDTADLVAEIGWDGIECPVRSKSGQIAPERVEEDLPR